MRTKLGVLTGGLLILGGLLLADKVTAAESADKPLSEERFKELHKELEPAADQPWRTIPWKIELLDAQRVAAERKLPIFIWAMDGHPLGCT